ncbi:MAG: hypothetical protein HKN39_06420 [Flavobacteriales bacterium]|nr:hypothetical protein [Flavobacteriales bacterium]
MRKFTHILTSFLVIAVLASCGKKECSDYHVGNFKYKDQNVAQASDIIIERTEDYHKESSEKENYEDTYSITWTSDCEYYMVYKRTTNPSRMPFSEFDTIFATITEVKENGYVFEALIRDKRPGNELIKID